MKTIHPKRKSRLGFALVLPLCATLGATLGGCTRDHKFQPVDMWNKTRLKPYEAVGIPGGTTALPVPAGAIARGQLITAGNEALLTGKTGGKLVTAFPFAINEKVLQRGQERYTIFCSPCHGGLGDGNGQIVRRGFAKPPDYADHKTGRRLVDAPVGHFFDVMTHGYGAMYSYAARVPVNDRWAIAAYIRVLQKAREPGRKAGGPLLPGGGVHEVDLKPSSMGAGGHGAGGHGAPAHGAPAHGEGTSSVAPHGADEVSPGVAPGSAVLEKGGKPGGAAEGPAHEKAQSSGVPDKAPEHTAPAGSGHQPERP